MQYLSRTILVTSALVLVLSLAGCGQKGELYIEPGETAPADQAAEAPKEDEQSGEDDED